MLRILIIAILSQHHLCSLIKETNKAYIYERVGYGLRRKGCADQNQTTPTAKKKKKGDKNLSSARILKLQPMSGSCLRSCNSFGFQKGLERKNKQKKKMEVLMKKASKVVYGKQASKLWLRMHIVRNNQWQHSPSHKILSFMSDKYIVQNRNRNILFKRNYKDLRNVKFVFVLSSKLLNK